MIAVTNNKRNYKPRATQVYLETLYYIFTCIAKYNKVLFGLSFPKNGLFRFSL